MEELLRSTAITLAVGPEQTITTVQANLFRGISEPLDRLLSGIISGHATTASVNECLRHDDKDAFHQLVHMAYNIVLKGGHNGHAMLPATSDTSFKALIKSDIDRMTTPQKSLVKCNHCKTPVFVQLECENGQCRETDYLGIKSFFQLELAQSHGSISKGLKESQAPSTPLDTKDKTTGKAFPLIHFAKVFHLAGKYEVPGLQASALKAFERRLKKYSTNPQKDIDELLDVLRYLASTTGWSSKESEEAEETAAASIDTGALLKSLMRYVIAHLEDLLEEGEFKEIVAEYGMIGLELMKVLKESIVASRGS